MQRTETATVRTNIRILKLKVAIEEFVGYEKRKIGNFLISKNNFKKYLTGFKTVTFRQFIFLSTINQEQQWVQSKAKS